MSNSTKCVSLLCFVIKCLVVATPIGCAQETSEVRTKLVEGPMTKLAPLLGAWEIDAEWKNGSSLWSRNDYTVGLGGKFIEARTYAVNKSGARYQRYLTFFGYDESKQQYMSWGFVYDGTQRAVPVSIEEQDGKVVITSEWDQESGSRIRQTVTVAEGESDYEWKVWQQSEDESWLEIMNGTWKRAD